MVPGANLLTVQKFIYLLDDFHYKEFRDHLAHINAALPLKLAEAIRKKLPAFDTHEQLCKKIYKAANKTDKQNFNQLSSYTFKLSAILATNYPEYLQTNIEKIQMLVADQKKEEADFLSARLLEVAEQVNDFPSCIFVLKFQSQQSQMAKDALRTKKTDLRLKEVIENQQLFFKLLFHYRVNIDAVLTPKPDVEIKELQQYFEGFTNYKCASIRIFCQFACLSVISELTAQKLTETDLESVKRIKKEITNHPHVVFPFLFDVSGNLQQMLLSSSFTNHFSKEAERSYKQLSLHFDTIKFWKNYINTGEMNLIAIQATGLLTKYHYQAHLTDYQKVITHADKRLMADLIYKCKKIMAQLKQKNDRPFEEVSVKMLYGALLILSGGRQIEEGIIELETMLTNYQQVNFKRSTSSIFLCLIVGYFSVRDYSKCNHTFKRYLKSVKGKLVFEGNRVKIHSYYYLSQWLATGSKQYAAKLEALLAADGNDGSQRTIWHLINHFKLPIPVPEGMEIALVL